MVFCLMTIFGCSSMGKNHPGFGLLPLSKSKFLEFNSCVCTSAPGVKRHLCFTYSVVLVQVSMLCGTCHKGPGTTCPCCRTLERICWIVRSPKGLPPFCVPRTLAILRETAGSLQDLFDEVHAPLPSPRVLAAGAPPTEGPPGETGARSSCGVVETGEVAVVSQSVPEVEERLPETTPKSKAQPKEKDRGKEGREKPKKKKKEHKEVAVEARPEVPSPPTPPQDTRLPEDEEVGAEAEREPVPPRVHQPFRVRGSAARHFDEAYSEAERTGERPRERLQPRSPSRTPPSRRPRGSKGRAHRERGRAWREERGWEQWPRR